MYRVVKKPGFSLTNMCYINYFLTYSITVIKCDSLMDCDIMHLCCVIVNISVTFI